MKALKRILLVFSLFFVVVLLGICFGEMEKKTILTEAEVTFSSAVSLDMNKRLKGSGQPYYFGFTNDKPSDEISIISEDSIRKIPKKKEVNSLTIEQKQVMALQTFFRDMYPLQVNTLDSIFKMELMRKGLNLPTAIHYKDHFDSSFLSTTEDSLFYQSAYKMEELPLGIEGEMSVQAFVQIPVPFLLGRIWKEWLLSGLACVFIGIGVFWLVKRNKKRVVEVPKLIPVKEIGQSESTDTYLQITGNIFFNPQKGEILYGDNQVIVLTAQQGALLRYFLESPDCFISNEEMEKNLRGDILDGKSWRSQVISRLRKTLQPIPELTIEAVWGKGYYLRLLSRK